MVRGRLVQMSDYDLILSDWSGMSAEAVQDSYFATALPNQMLVIGSVLPFWCSKNRRGKKERIIMALQRYLCRFDTRTGRRIFRW